MEMDIISKSQMEIRRTIFKYLLFIVKYIPTVQT